MKPFMSLISVRNVLLLCAVLFSTSSHAQKYPQFLLIKDDSIYKQKLLKAAEDKYNADIAAISGEHKKVLKEIYKERFDEIKANFTSNAIIADPVATGYLDAIVQQVLTANPELAKVNPRIYLTRAWWPNASSMGEGTILVNIGIIYKLENEAQLVFAICHELAHLYLDHGNKAITKYVNTVLSEDFQKELKQIKKQQYGKNKELDNMVKALVFKDRRHSREHESEADSVGLEFMRKTSFDISQGAVVLGMLDSIDKDKYNIEPPLKKYFNHTAYPFQDAWMKQQDAFFGGISVSSKEKKMEDSLKTHPDCKERVLKITPMANRLGSGGTVKSANQAVFEEWKRKFDKEVVAFTYNRKAVSLALYYALQMLETYPDDPWLLSVVGNSLNRMYTAQKDHELNNIVDLPQPRNEKKYNQFLEFIQNLTLSDIAAISYYFMEANKQKGLQEETFVQALIYSKGNFDKPAEKQEWINYYKKTFNKPNFNF